MALYYWYGRSHPSGSLTPVSPVSRTTLVPRQQSTRGPRRRDFIIAVHRSYLEIAGDTETALFLAQLNYWSERTTNPEGWVYKSHAEWKSELNMGRWVVNRARRKLAGLGLIEQTNRMVNNRRTMHFRIRREALRQALRGYEARCDEPCADNSVDETEFYADDAPEDGTVVCMTPADRSAGFLQTGLPESSTPGTETTAETTTETLPCDGKPSPPPRQPGRPDKPAIDTAQQYRSTADGSKIRSKPHRSRPVISHGGQDGVRDAEYERQLAAVLERLPAFRRHRSPRRLREIVADYPEEVSVLELKKFAEYWSTKKLELPWLALRNWLERTRRLRARPRRGGGTAPQTGRPARGSPANRMPRRLPLVYTAPPVYDDG